MTPSSRSEARRRWRAALLAAAAGSLLVAPGGEADARAAAQPRHHVVALAEGVHAVVRDDPLSLAGNGNSLVVVGDSGVLVVDAQFTAAATLETLAAIRRLTSKPVRWVVNTHWHDDHLAGNRVYRDSFPGVQFIAHANTRRDVRLLGGPNREGTATGAPPLAARFERLLGQGLGIDSTPVSPAERAAVRSALDVMGRYLAELPTFTLAIDGPTVEDHLALDLGGQRVELRWFGRANTEGDLVVHLPAHGVVATGDLVVAPVPFAFGSFPREWVGVLDSIAALRPRALLPGHGEVQRDLAYLRRVQSALRTIDGVAAAAARRGDSLATALRAPELAALRPGFATGDEKWDGYTFRNFLLRPAAQAAYEQARAPARPDGVGGVPTHGR